MILKNAKYVKDLIDNKIQYIEVEIDGKIWSVPQEEGNRFFKEIKKQLDAGTISIKDAE